jgi:hypothetical protein
MRALLFGLGAGARAVLRCFIVAVTPCSVVLLLGLGGLLGFCERDGSWIGTGITGSHGTGLFEHEDRLRQLATHSARVERSIHQWSTRGTGRGWWPVIDRSGGFKWQRKLKRELPRQLSR